MKKTRRRCRLRYRQLQECALRRAQRQRLTGEDKEALARKTEEVGLREMDGEMPIWYGRDAANVRRSNAVVLIGADKK